MPFIWVSASGIMHPAVGALFLLWLAFVGAMLATGRLNQRASSGPEDAHA